MAITRLKEEELYQRCDIGQFDFKSTAELETLTDIIGQDRAVEAVRFGIGIQREGYNLFALGPNGIGKYSLVRSNLEEKARTEDIASDWCYVNNFKQAHKPHAIELPPGMGQQRLSRASANAGRRIWQRHRYLDHRRLAGSLSRYP